VRLLGSTGVRLVVCDGKLDAHGDQPPVFVHYAKHRGVAALVADSVVGFWALTRRNDLRIDSRFTWVHPQRRRDGIARALWQFGIGAWNPTIVTAVASSPEGGQFLAAMLPWCLKRGVDLRVVTSAAAQRAAVAQLDGTIYRAALQRVCGAR